jgi:HEAT repeat protein
MRAWLCVVVWAVLAGAVSAQDATYQGKTVAEWTKALKRKDADVRYQALAALYEAGAEAGPAMAEVVKLLKDSEVRIRRGAVHVLLNIEQDGIPAALSQALRDANPGVRQLAAKGLSELGEPGQMVLVDAVADKDANVKLLAMAALDSMEATGKETVLALGGAAKDANLSVRKAALYMLGQRIVDEPDARPFVAQALRDKDQSIRVAAAKALVAAGNDAAVDLANAAKDGDAGTRTLALQALGAIGEDLNLEGLTALVRGLDDPEARVRQAAANGIAQLKTNAREVAGAALFKELAKLLQDKEATVRRAAVVALGSIGVVDGDEVGKIADGLKDGDSFVRGFTVQALGACCLAEGASETVILAALTHLAAGLRDTDARVQNMAAQLLAREEGRSVPVLIPIVEKGQGKQRLWAASILGEIGAGAADAIPALEKMGRDTNAQVRQSALTALRRIRE